MTKNDKKAFNDWKEMAVYLEMGYGYKEISIMMHTDVSYLLSLENYFA